MKLQGVVYINDYQGNPIEDKITSFKYKFSEEEDDVCEILIESDDRLLADTPAYQEGRELIVQWGWVNGEMSKTRKVYIFDTFPEYGEVVKLKLVCHEKFVIAKMDVAANRNETTLKPGTPLILSPTVLSALNVTLDKGSPELQKLLTENNIVVKDNKIQYKKYQHDKREVSYFNGNMSTFQSLKTFLSKLPGGPYIIESRDDGVNIKTRDLAQSSKRKWTYRGGNEELIEFKPEKKTRSKASNSNKVSVTNWDRLNKTATTQESSWDDPDQIKLANSQLITEWSIFRPKGEPQLQYAPTYGLPLANQTPKRATGVLASLGGLGVDPNKKFKKVYTGYDFGLRETTATTPGVSSLAVAKPMFKFVEDTPEPKDNVLSTEDDSEKALAEADNRRKDQEIKNEKGSARMLGDPSIECGIIVTFDGVSSKDGGNYYVFTCEHTIDQNGYILDMLEIGRQGVNRSTVKPPTKDIESVNNPFPQWDPYQQKRNQDYKNKKDKNWIAPHIPGAGASDKEYTLVQYDQVYINQSVGVDTQYTTRKVIPVIKNIEK